MATVKKPDNGKCQSCGACKECGAHPQIVPMPYPVYPQPWATYPWQPNYPYWQVTYGQSALGSGDSFQSQLSNATSPQTSGGTFTNYTA